MFGAGEEVGAGEETDAGLAVELAFDFPAARRSFKLIFV
jgi:hypothetical protein